MRVRPVLILCVLMGAVLSACGVSPAGRAAKKDAAVIGQSAALARAGVASAQDANAQLAEDNAASHAQDSALRSDAQRIDDKAVILQNARWTP